MKLIILIFSFVLFSCSKTYDQETCEDLSLKTYQGHPNSANEFKKSCEGVKNNYPREKCNKAFQDLVMNGKAEFLKSKYGPKILKCFNKNDLEKFLSK